MIKTEKKISQTQLFFMLIQAQVGIGIISLPYAVANISKGDAWISVLIAGIFVQISSVIIWLLNRRFPSLTIFEMLNEIVGKNIASIIKIAYIAHFFSTATLIILLFVQTVNLWILPRTPIWLVSILMIAICVYCAKENLRVMARFNVVISIFLVILLVLITYILKDINYLYILPVGESGISTIFKGSTQAITASLGFEVLLVLLPYSLGKSREKLKISLMANGLVSFFYVYLTFVVLTYFGPAALKFIPEPILYIMKFQSFRIIERTDLLFFSIWIVTVGSTIMIYLYMTSNGLTNMFKKTKHATFVYYIAFLMFLLVLFIPINEKTLNLLNKYISIASYFYIFVLPLMLLLVSIIRGKKELSGAVKL